MKLHKKKHLISIIIFIFIGLSYFIFIKFEEEANKQKYKSELYRKVYIVFNKFDKVTIQRKEEYGGNKEYNDYQLFEKDYKKRFDEISNLMNYFGNKFKPHLIF